MQGRWRYWCVSAAAGITMAAMPAMPSFSAELTEPPVFASKNGTLDILIVAKPAVIPFDGSSPTGWVYEICPRPTDNSNLCPSSQTNWYGGVRLQLQQGDTLYIRLVNKLPTVTGAKHAADPGYDYLTLNPTNLHTHGMLVSAHYPTMANQTYGDNVFVLTFNSANGAPNSSAHLHGDVRYDFTDYEIKIPQGHPSGLFWFHPHAHGIALNQISSGMAGIITIGSPTDYICGEGPCGPSAPTTPVRHMILKDTQVVYDSLFQESINHQQEPAFCTQTTQRNKEPPRRGSCIGGSEDEGGTASARKSTRNPAVINFVGIWLFTINGQQYPNIPVASPTGEIWRITNASASVSYDLRLRDDAQNRHMLMQVVSIDGVSISPEAGTSLAQLAQLGGAKFEPEQCPTDSAKAPIPQLYTTPHSYNAPLPQLFQETLCVRRLVMFPSSRVEVWVTYRDSDDIPAAPPSGASAVFRTSGLTTGPGGDAWPEIELAQVNFTPDGSSSSSQVLSVKGQGRALSNPTRLASELGRTKSLFPATADCVPLASGHKRRIFFNFAQVPPTASATSSSRTRRTADSDLLPFGLGYEEVDEMGNPVPGTFQDVSVFDPATQTICVPLGANDTPVKEVWELVNLAPEDHNFHMHQSKFRLLAKDEIAGTTVPESIIGKGILHDNVPVVHADGACNSVQDWRDGLCQASPVTIEIPFTIPGDYVYHCHILEHEDGGMMARIRVRSSQ